MVSTLKYKFISDFTSLKVSHPDKSLLTLMFRRKPNGEQYFSCSSSSSDGNRPLFMSATDLKRIFNEVDNWMKEEYDLSSVTNEEGIIISGGGLKDTNRLTLVLGQHNNIPSVDVRNWWRPKPEGIFRPSSIGFFIAGPDKITSFMKMNEDITKRLDDVDKLDAIINMAHGVMYKVYTENYSFDAQCAPVMSVVDIESFTRLWNERLKTENLSEGDLAFSPRDIYTYITTEGLSSLEQYITCTEFLLRHIEEPCT